MSDFAKFLAGADAALSVIKSVADTPGVNLLPYASTVSNAVSTIRAAVDAGVAVSGYIESFRATFEGGTPTVAELDALDARIAELRGRLHAPLPPKEAGEPD